MNFRLRLPVTALFAAGLFVSCLEKEEGLTIENIEEKLDGQRFDLARSTEFVEAQKLKLAAYEKAASDLKEVDILTHKLEEVQGNLEEARIRNSDTSDTVELTQLEFGQYRAAFRVKARKAAIGKIVDLSPTKGADYKSVRILSVTPLGVKVYLSSGPGLVPVKELTPEVQDMLQIGDDEVAAYYEKRQANAALRAENFKNWKKGQAGRDDESAKAAFREKMKEIRDEIIERENKINIRIQQIKGWKSKASNLELRASQERRRKSGSKSKTMAHQADLARDKADELSLYNSDSWIVVGRLKAELEDLKRMGVR